MSALPDETQQDTSNAALAAISRLLLAAADAEGPRDVRAAIVREARALIGAQAAVLVVRHRDDFEVLAIDSAGDVPPDPLPRALSSALRDLDGPEDPFVSWLDAEASAMTFAACGIPASDCGGRPAAVIELVGRAADHLLLLACVDPAPGRQEAFAAMGAFVNAASASVMQLRLLDEHAMQIARQSSLARAAKSLTESLDVKQVISRIVAEAARILEAETAACYTADGDDLVVEAAFGFPPETLGHRLPIGRGLSGRVLVTGEAMLTDEYQRLTDPPAGSPFKDIIGCLAAPLRWDGEIRGVLSVGYRRDVEMTREQLNLLETFAELASAAYGNANAHAGLAAQARTDGLTGCLNHAALQTALQNEVERARRNGHGCAVVLLDLDDFKGVNEAHGHLVGDEVLRRVGDSLRQAVRPFDIAARYGGDEFAIVAPNVDEHEAAVIATRAVARITSGLRDVVGGSGRVVTAGIAEWNPSLDAAGLLARADTALMQGKRGGEFVMRASQLPEGLTLRTVPLAPAPNAPAHLIVSDALAYQQTQRLRKRTRQLALASGLGARLSAMNDVDEICAAAVDELNRAFGYYLCSVIEIRTDGYVHARSVRGDHFERLGDRRWSQPRAAGVIGRCLRERRTIVIEDVHAEASYVATDETMDVRSELVSPLWVGDQLWGAINLEALEVQAFDEDDARLVQTVSDQVGSALRSALLYEQLDRAYIGTAEALAAALEAKDSYTAHHARSILEHADSVGLLLGLDDSSRRVLRFAGIFHDIGKIAVPEMILNKRGPLNDSEWQIVERHTLVGEQILAPVEFLAPVRPLVRHEHERWDGSGYPDGLAGEEIPLGSRIVLACDAYHAMTSDRPYRDAMPAADAREELRSNAGTQFDPDVVAALLEVLSADDESGTEELRDDYAPSSTRN